MRSLYLYLLLVMGTSCIYGQSIMSSANFVSSASVIYLNSNPKLYLEDSKVRFFVSSKPVFLPKKVNRYEENYDLEILIRYKYSHLSKNIKFNNGVAIDVSDYSKKDEYVRDSWRDEFTFIESLLIGILFGH